MLIKNGKIYTMAGDVYENGDILIEDGKIKKVAREIKDYSGEIIDASGAVVIPGMIDAHCHLGMWESGMGFEGNDGNEATDPITPEMRAIDGINPMDHYFDVAVEAGITTVMTGPGSANVVGGQFVVMKTYGNNVDKMKIVEPAAMKIAFGENPKRVYNGKGKMPSTRMGTAALLRKTIMEAENYKAKKENAEKKGEYFEKNIKMEAFLPVLEGKMPLKAHCHRADDILTAIRIAKEFDLKLTLDHCSEGHLISDDVKESGCPAIIGPTMSNKSKIEVKNKSFETPAALMHKGVKVAIMTDHPVIEINYLPICAGLAQKAGNLTFEEALSTITINAAEILGVSDRLGSIEEGKDADVVILDGNPLDTYTNTLYTIINGEVVYKR
ncbi:amidohydrolase [Clostridium cadaveris]|uniref:amidohydrolase n=1 Tax=Clostridium cadaveris TaxID=1529 RepID=UPI0015B48E8B|nr:amidohydrolase [Clostridium cadaveris]NWK10839.1 amidohydrolase [Clostridium cadaveris]